MEASPNGMDVGMQLASGLEGRQGGRVGKVPGAVAFARPGGIDRRGRWSEAMQSYGGHPIKGAIEVDVCHPLPPIDDLMATRWRPKWPW